MEKVSWTNRVRTEEVLRTVKEERNVLHTIKRREANWIGYILRMNCLLQHIIEGKIGDIEVMRRNGRRLLLVNLKETRGYRTLKQDALDRTIWRNRYGHLVRQNTELIN
jgi:hypothetical protein